MRPRNIGLVLIALGIIFALSSVVYLGPGITLSLTPASPVTLQLASLDHSLGDTVRSELWVYHLQGNYTGQAVAGSSVVEIYYKRAAPGEALPDNTLMGSNCFSAGQQFVFNAAMPVSQEGWRIEMITKVLDTLGGGDIRVVQNTDGPAYFVNHQGDMAIVQFANVDPNDSKEQEIVTRYSDFPGPFVKP